jgi:carbon storage regulator
MENACYYTRKVGQSVRIGQDVVVKVVGVHGGQVQLAFEAPGQFVCREEMGEEEKAKFREAFATVAQ